jgi:hypothetical protein
MDTRRRRPYRIFQTRSPIQRGSIESIERGLLNEDLLKEDLLNGNLQSEDLLNGNLQSEDLLNRDLQNEELLNRERLVVEIWIR